MAVITPPPRLGKFPGGGGKAPTKLRQKKAGKRKLPMPKTAPMVGLINR